MTIGKIYAVDEVHIQSTACLQKLISNNFSSLFS